MADPKTLCVDITGGTAFTAVLMLKAFGKEDDGKDTVRYTMTGSGTVAGGPVELSVLEAPCTDPGPPNPKQSWTCEITSADGEVANYILRGGEGGDEEEGGKTRSGSVPIGSCSIPAELPCGDPG